MMRRMKNRTFTV